MVSFAAALLALVAVEIMPNAAGIGLRATPVIAPVAENRVIAPVTMTNASIGSGERCSIPSLLHHLQVKGVTGTMEPGTDAAEFVEEQNLIKEVAAKTVCETGFNWGGSSLAWLCTSPQITVQSFDLGFHSYGPIARSYLWEEFGKNRLTVTFGDSTVTLPAVIAREASASADKKLNCDVAFVDGGHSFQVALADIKNFKALTKPKGRLLLENCNVNGEINGWGGMKAVNDAYQEALRQGIIEHEKQVSTAACQGVDMTLCREMCVAHYV